MKKGHTIVFVLLFFLGLFVAMSLFASPGYAEPKAVLSKGQSVYVPAYSNVFITDKERPFYLTATLSIRNADPGHSINIVSVEYYDSDGKLVKSYVDKPVQVGPMASAHYSIKESDRSGGFGANFIVRWKSQNTVNEPVIECVMISSRGKLGISFITHGRVINE